MDRIRCVPVITICIAGLILLCSYTLFPTVHQLLFAIKSAHCEGQAKRQNAKVFEQRNKISRQLNKLQEKYGQLYCEMKKDVSETGGWCIKKASTNKHVTDFKLAEALSNFLANKTVASFGDGPGNYARHILKTGRVPVYDAYDGAPYSYQITQGLVHFLDLTLEQYGLPVYDWVVSLEVIEHIPAEFEQVVLLNFVRHAREGLVLSWAVEGQGGFHHVNCRNLDYVLRVLGNLGFQHDARASKELQTEARVAWLRNNINVFRRRPTAKLDEHEA